MAKVTAQLEQRARMQVNPLLVDTIDQDKLWVHYDEEADSIVIYITGAPVFAISVAVEDDTYLKVDPTTGNVVGFHVEAWAQCFLPNHPELQMAWQQMEKHAEPNPGLRSLLRMIALWVIFILKSDNVLSSPLQPA